MAADHHIFLQKKFTLKQMQIIALKVRGLTDKQIGAYLKMAETTAKSHMKAIRQILGGITTYNMQISARDSGVTTTGYYGDANLFEGETNMPWHEDATSAPPAADQPEAPVA
jgi:DNA-binding CsgD family transcriptional regulator